MSDFSTSAYRVARKLHRCDECRCAIEPGARYLRGVSVVDGRADTYRLCLPCDVLTEYAWDIVRRDRIHEDDGPHIGGTMAWLADYERPELLVKQMPAAVAEVFAARLKGVQNAGE